ncbi:MAG: hypothetical protein R3F00_16260 [Dokdonella sp.]
MPLNVPASPSMQSRQMLMAAPGPKARLRNIARQIAIRAGLPVSVPGATVNRFCACGTGLQTIAMAAQRDCRRR